MSGFFVMFDEKEGTTNLVMLLDQFQGISVVRQVDKKGWEPFDWYKHRSLTPATLMQCLDLLFSPGEANKEKLNRLYLKSAKRALDDYDKAGSVGFKMRVNLPPEPGRAGRIFDRLSPAWIRKLNLAQRWFEYRLISILKKHRIVVLVAVRQDLLRWALSKYHGDGTGKEGHLQFKIAFGDMNRADIPAIEVDPARLRELINERIHMVNNKLRLMRKMNRRGVMAQTVIYEEYLENPKAFFRQLLDAIGHPVNEDEIARVIENGSPIQKVHSNDISEFVSNHEEIEAEFGESFIDMNELLITNEYQESRV